MNNDRRKDLNTAIDLIEKIKADFETAKGLIRDAAEGEQEGFDNLTEGLQAAERGQRMEEVAGELSNVADEMDGIDFDDLISRIDDAKA